MSTIILASRSILARADGIEGNVSILRQARAAGSLVDAVEASVALGGKLRGPVWVLTDEVFTQAISVAAGAVRGLPEAEVAKALAFEASTLSGVAAEHSLIAWKALPGESRESEFWVTQIGRPEMEQVRLAVAKLGGKLAGIAHPAGVPAPLRAREGPWRRVEIWQDLSATVEGVGDGAIVVRAGRGDLSRRTPTDLAPSEILIAGTRPPPMRIDADIVRLDDEATLQAWLGLWANALSQKTPAVPLVRPPDRVLGQSIRIGVAAGGFAAIVALAVLHYFPLRAERAQLEADLARVQEPAKKLAEIKKQVDAAEAEATKLRAAGGPVGTAWSRLPARIMDVLTSRVPQGLVVDDFDAGWDRATIRGLCKDPVTADRLAEALEQDLAKDNCRVTPALKALHSQATGQYEFEIEIVSSFAPASSAAAARPRSRRGD
ncbi:MAG TPA: hypothetical protein VE981_10880 [Planctomycetota bacterium]|nr:hypothetical protein [Planctomycetota bacterium]